ncbi:hypothetical protein ACH4FX_11475 [Streptomyces sp. NPDC018019]
MGKQKGEEWAPQENEGAVTDPDTRVSRNGDVHSSVAGDKDREGT